jgi:hypothetical protein
MINCLRARETANLAAKRAAKDSLKVGSQGRLMRDITLMMCPAVFWHIDPWVEESLMAVPKLILK